MTRVKKRQKDTRGAGPPKVGHNLKEVFRRRDQLGAVLSFEFHDKFLDRSEFDRLIGQCLRGLPGGILPEVVEDSVPELFGVRGDHKKLVTAAWRLAGNLSRLQAGLSAPPWSAQRGTEWAPLSVIGASPARRRDALGWEVEFRVLAGTACPLTTRRWWSPKTCRALSRHFGFSRPLPQNSRRSLLHPFVNADQFVTLRLLALLEPELSEHGPGFLTVEFPSAIQAWNRTQHLYRGRRDAAHACPFGYERDWPCHRCHVGYRECRAGTHRETYVPRPCAACKREDALFDPARRRGDCVNCERTRVLHGPV
jgi:hypothetical protein